MRALLVSTVIKSPTAIHVFPAQFMISLRERRNMKVWMCVCVLAVGFGKE